MAILPLTNKTGEQGQGGFSIISKDRESDPEVIRSNNSIKIKE